MDPIPVDPDPPKPVGLGTILFGLWLFTWPWLMGIVVVAGLCYFCPSASRVAWQPIAEALFAPGILLPYGVLLSAFPAILLTLSLQRLRTRRDQVVVKLRRMAGREDPDDRITTSRGFAMIAFLSLLCLLGFATAQVRAYQSDLKGVACLGAVDLAQEPWVGLALFGFAGAYSYVLASVIVRVRAGDIPDEALARFARVLIAGPLLAALVVVIPGSTEGPPDAQGNGDTVMRFLAFALGAFPSLADEYLARAARRVLGGEHIAPVARPLANLSGMTAAILERLEEAGIEDAQHLCFASPFQLIARLPFPPRQILDWMDEALLYRYLTTKEFQNRTEAGITGAIDLVWNWERLRHPEGPCTNPAHPKDAAPPGGEASSSPGKGMGDLANALGMDDAALERICPALAEDQQFQLIWDLFAEKEASSPWAMRRAPQA